MRYKKKMKKLHEEIVSGVLPIDAIFETGFQYEEGSIHRDGHNGIYAACKKGDFPNKECHYYSLLGYGGGKRFKDMTFKEFWKSVKCDIEKYKPFPVYHTDYIQYHNVLGQLRKSISWDCGGDDGKRYYNSNNHYSVSLDIGRLLAFILLVIILILILK